MTTTGPSRLQLTVRHPNSVAFMYSPQPLIVASNGNAGALAVTAKLTHMESGRTHIETRAFYDGAVRFDLSRIMQLLAPDVDTLFQRLDYNTGQSLSEAFSLLVSYRDTDGQTYEILEREDITALYGALDQGEIYGEHTQRRLWVNFPQTFNLWKDALGEVAFVLEDSYIYPDTAGNKPCHECDLIGTMQAIGDTAGLAKIIPGRPMRNVGLTWKTRVEKGAEIPEEFRTVTLVPDDCKEGTYLRWLNRRGEVSYWLFKNSQIRVTSAISNNFARFYEGDPSEPVADAYTNSQKTDYREARELVLGAVGLSYDEFEDLCDLATSPLVERLMPNVAEEDTEVDIIYDGGHAKTNSNVIVESGANQDTEVDGGNAGTGRLAGTDYVWQRVNVAAGSYNRSIKRSTPNRQELEFVIELPERNTIKL